MQVYNFRPMDVKDYFKPALTPEDRDRLDAADAYYMDAGDGWHIFGQACANEHCFGCWTATVHERNTRDFALAIDRACNTEAVCHACWLKANVLPPSLITYRAKSASESGGNGGSRGRSHRNRQSKAGTPRMSRRQIEARINQLAAMIANPGANTPDEVIAAWQREQEALTAVLVSYSRKAVA
jgi:hypothetical protein